MEIGGLASQAHSAQRGVAAQNLSIASLKTSLQADQGAAQLLAGVALPAPTAPAAHGGVGSNLDIQA